MKKIIDKVTILLLLSFIFLTSCDEFDREEAVPTISVNIQSLKMFVGDETTLIAGPQGSGYVWESEDLEVATVSNGVVTAVKDGNTNVIVRKGELFLAIPVAVVTKIHLTGIDLSTDRVGVFPNGVGKATVSVRQIPEDANEFDKTDFYWWTEDESIAVVNSKGEISGVKLGNTKIFYRKGSFVKSVDVDVVPTLPFKGPHIISKEAPLVLELRQFDLGGEGNAYHDTDASNSAGSNYRKDNGDSNSPGVDVEGGGNIGYVSDGEWLIYTVEVNDAGTYAVQINASGTAEGKFHLQVNEVDKTGQITVPSNGSWSNWTWYPSTPVELTFAEGKQTIKLYVDKSGFNMNHLKFTFLR